MQFFDKFLELLVALSLRMAETPAGCRSARGGRVLAGRYLDLRDAAARVVLSR